jgi:hypothetical protein
VRASELLGMRCADLVFARQAAPAAHRGSHLTSPTGPASGLARPAAKIRPQRVSPGHWQCPLTGKEMSFSGFRLARSVGAEKRDGFTARDGKVDAANGSDLTVRLVKAGEDYSVALIVAGNHGTRLARAGRSAVVSPFMSSA